MTSGRGRLSGRSSTPPATQETPCSVHGFLDDLSTTSRLSANVIQFGFCAPRRLKTVGLSKTTTSALIVFSQKAAAWACGPTASVATKMADQSSQLPNFVMVASLKLKCVSNLIVVTRLSHLLPRSSSTPQPVWPQQYFLNSLNRGRSGRRGSGSYGKRTSAAPTECRRLHAGNSGEYRGSCLLSLFPPGQGPSGPGASLSVAPNVDPGACIRRGTYSELEAKTGHQARGQNWPDPWTRPNLTLWAGR